MSTLLCTKHFASQGAQGTKHIILQNTTEKAITHIITREQNSVT